MRGCFVQGREVPEDLVGELADSARLLDDPAALRRRLAEDGYLFLRGVLDRDAVMAARREVLARLSAVDEIVPGGDVFTGRSARKAREPDLGRFWRSVSEGPALRAATHGRDISRVMEIVAGEAPRAQDFLFLRVGVPGRATGLHFDYPFFTRLHDQVWTVWTSMGDTPVSRGPLMVVENSHRFSDLVESVVGFDVVRDTSRKAAFAENAIDSFMVESSTPSAVSMDAAATRATRVNFVRRERRSRTANMIGSGLRLVDVVPFTDEVAAT